MTPRFFVDQPLDVALSANSPITLPDTASHHALRVLRLEDGDTLILFNGDGYPYEARLVINGKKALANLVSVGPRDPQRAIKLTLIQCLSTAEKMDWTLEKATELGAEEIVVVQSERSKVRLDSDRVEKKLERWQELIHAACGQCGRNTVPTLNYSVTLKQSLSAPAVQAFDETFIFTLGEHPLLVSQMREVQPACNSLRLVIGPESGFSDKELDVALKLGARPTSLGWRVLRTETAGPAVLAVAEAWLSDRAANLR